MARLGEGVSGVADCGEDVMISASEIGEVERRRIGVGRAEQPLHGGHAGVDLRGEGQVYAIDRGTAKSHALD